MRPTGDTAPCTAPGTSRRCGATPPERTHDQGRGHPTDRSQPRCPAAGSREPSAPVSASEQSKAGLRPERAADPVAQLPARGGIQWGTQERRGQSEGGRGEPDQLGGLPGVQPGQGNVVDGADHRDQRLRRPTRSGRPGRGRDRAAIVPEIPGREDGQPCVFGAGRSAQPVELAAVDPPRWTPGQVVAVVAVRGRR